MASISTTSILTVLLTIVLACQRCETFLFDNDCPASTPCTCSGNADHAFVTCNGHQLTSMPQFRTTQLNSKDVIIFLNDNKLTTIPNYAFKNLGSIHATTMHLQLDSNMITTIDVYAFNGIENTVTILQLQNNKLRSVPSAVGHLRHLEYLDISNNPLLRFGSSDMSAVGQSLQTLYVSLHTFSVWPTELAYLNRLEHLTLYDIPYQHINSTAFQGLEKTLKTLTIKKAPMLRKVPSAICQLSKLTLLSLDHFEGLVSEDGLIFENCTQTLQTLNTFTIDFSNLTSFPDVLNIFPAVSTLNLVGNSLNIIKAEVIPERTAVAKIDLDSNKFFRIPSALNKMKNLTDIDLTNNAIVSVEDMDLAGLLQLKTLRLTDNPLRYISNHAFDNNKILATLDLGRTQIKKIPIAVTTLVYLTVFDISGTHISCDCEMSYLRYWDIHSITSFSGNCDVSNANIRNFIMTSLQQCPKQ